MWLLWSPDGSRLTWTDLPDGPYGTSGIVRVTSLPLDGGTHSRQVTSLRGWSYAVAWLPDGQHLLVGNIDATDGDAPPPRTLWRIRADGADPVLLATDFSGAALQPTP